MESPGAITDARAKIRTVGTSTAVGAALLLYFGYVTLAEPTGTELFEQAALLLYHTLRIGGAASAVIAILLWAGLPAALVPGAIVAILIGAGLMLSGTGMVVGGGGLLQPVICVVGGWLFIRSGIYSARLWKGFARRPAVDAPQAPSTSPAEFEERVEEEVHRIGTKEEEDAGAGPIPTSNEARGTGHLASFARKRDGTAS